MNIFISHTNSDQETASDLKRIIADLSQNQVEIFVSSDDVSIPSGKDWLRALSDVIKNTQLTIALCSEQSIKKPWLNIEIGASWIRNIPIIPVCYSGVFISDLEAPLSYYNALEIENDLFVKSLYRSIEQHLKVKYIDNIEKVRLLQNQLIHNINQRTTNFNYNKFSIFINHNKSDYRVLGYKEYVEYVADILCNVTDDYPRNVIVESLLSGEIDIQVNNDCDVKSLIESLELYNTKYINQQ